MRIASLHTYPVKGFHRLDHDVALVDLCGLAGDRRWMIVDADGVGVTQRDVADLATLRAQPRPGGLTIGTDFEVAEPVDGPAVQVRVFTGQPAVAARLAPDEAHARLTRLLARPVRLAWLADPAARPVPSGPARPDDRVSFADEYPMLLANTASLDAINDWLLEAGDEPVPIARFRPNIVVAGAPAWAEDDWIGRRLRLGDLVVRVAKPCDRCVVTTIDQDTGEKSRQPLRALGLHRRYAAGLLFGLHLVAERPGTLHVGDPLELLP